MDEKKEKDKIKLNFIYYLYDISLKLILQDKYQG